MLVEINLPSHETLYAVRKNFASAGGKVRMTVSGMALISRLDGCRRDSTNCPFIENGEPKFRPCNTPVLIFPQQTQFPYWKRLDYL